MSLESLVLAGGTLIFALFIVCGTIILRSAIVAAGPNEPAIFGRLGGGGNAVRIVVLFAVIVTAFFLAVPRHLDQSTAALLSAVAGFALGGLEKPKA